MKYAKEYAQRRYSEYQIAFALHKEYCKEDKTERYAVHMAINRTNLKTGKRLAEGRGEIAKIDRARTIRELDDEWDLQQVEKDKPNSKIHSRQARGAEKEITERGEKSYKRNLRRWCDRLADRSSSLPEFCSLLEAAGYKVTTTNNKVFVVDLDHETNKQGQNIVFNLSKLDGRFSKKSLESSFAEKGTIKAVKQGLQQIQQSGLRLEAVKLMNIRIIFVMHTMNIEKWCINFEESIKMKFLLSVHRKYQSYCRVIVRFDSSYWNTEIELPTYVISWQAILHEALLPQSLLVQTRWGRCLSKVLRNGQEQQLRKRNKRGLLWR